MDVATVYRNVQRRFGDDAEVFISKADMIDWINAGQFHIAQETKCLSTTQTQNASTFPITLPTDLLKIERITYDGVPIPFRGVEELDTLSNDLTLTGYPQVYYISNEKINLYPDPLSTDTTSVIVYYSKIPTTITVEADPLTIPIMLHHDLVTFVLIKAHERNENWKAVEVLSADYNKMMPHRLEDNNVIDDTYPVVRDY